MEPRGAFLDAARKRMDRMGLDRRARPTITKPQGESIFQTGFHDRALTLAPMARRLPSLDPPCTCNDRAGSVFAGSCIWRSKHARIEHFHTSPGKHCPGPLLPNSKTYFGAGATRNPFQVDQGSTLRKWSAVDGSFRTHSIPSKVALPTKIPLREKGLEIPTNRDGRSSRSGRILTISHPYSLGFPIPSHEGEFW